MKLYRIIFCLVGFASGAQSADLVPVADFARHVQYRSVEISPNGDYLAADAVVDNKHVLAVIKLDDMKSLKIVPRADDELVDFTWVSPKRLVYTVGTKLGGLERPVSTGELYFVNADGSGNDVLFGYRAGKEATGSHIKLLTAERASAFLIDELRDDDKNILIWTVGWDTTGDGVQPVVWRFDALDGSKKQLFASPVRYPSGFLADHTGTVHFAYGANSDDIWKVMYRAKDGDEWETAFDGSTKAGSSRPTPLAFDADNKTVFWSCEPDGKVGGICTWSADARDFKAVWTSKDVEASSLIKDFDGVHIAAVKSYPGKAAVALIDKNAAVVKTLVPLMQQFPGEDVSIISRTRSGNRAVVEVSSDVNPGELYLLDRDTKKLQLLLKRADWIKPDSMAGAEPIQLKSRDGLVLNGYLTRPVGKEEAKNLPMVVFVHGGPFGIRDEWTFDPNVQLLASRGYAVLQVNFRGSGGYGEGFELAGYREWGGKMQDDITDATKWAIAQGYADAKSVCIYGGSYGGYASLMAVMKEPDLYRCAIGDAGIYDLRLMYSRGDTQQSTIGETYLKRVLGEDQKTLVNNSPISNLDRLKAKVMLVVGGQDKRVPPVHGETLHMALEKRHVEHEYLYERTEGHGFYDEKNRAAMFEKLLAFLDKNIGSGNSGPAAKTSP
ncbi:MAG: S9 family peptidase [Tahibacter sp.]